MFNKLENDLTEICAGQLIALGYTKNIHDIILQEINIFQNKKNVPIVPISLIPISNYQFRDSLQSFTLFRTFEKMAKEQKCIIFLLYEISGPEDLQSFIRKSSMAGMEDASDKIICITQKSQDILILNVIKNRAGNLGQIEFCVKSNLIGATY